MVLVIGPNPAVDTVMWIDHLRLCDVTRARRVVRYAGGKGVHVGLALRELGVPSRLLGFWGGPPGRWVRDQALAMGLTCVGPEVQEWTRTNLALRGPEGINETEILEPGPEVDTVARAEFMHLLQQELQGVSVVALCGSLPPGVPPDFYAQCVRAARAQGARVVLDFTGPALEHCLELEPDAVHLNHKEAAGLQITIPGLFALTRGAEGLELRREGRRWLGNVKLERVLGTVGSGDCLVAGLSWAMLEGCDDVETVRRAVACGAANCLREELGLLYRADVERLRPMVKVEECK